MVDSRYFDSALRALIDQPCVPFQGHRRAYTVVEAVLFLSTLAFAVLAWPALRSRLERWRIGRGSLLYSPSLFQLSMIVTLFVCRWPKIIWPGALGHDESVMLSGAITLQFDPLFWRTVQSTTSGPLNIYPLMWPALVGMPIDYAGARLLAAALGALCLVVLYATFRQLSGDASARLAVLPAWAFYATATQWDFVQYTSETVPVLIQTVAVFLTVLWLSRPQPGWGMACAIGLLLGTLPFAKLQAAPVGMALAACILVIMALRRPDGDSIGGLGLRIGSFVLCGLIPTGLVLALVAANGVGSRFMHAFVRYNLSFAAATRAPFLSGLWAALMSCVNVPEFSDLSVGLAIGIALLLALMLVSRSLPGRIDQTVRRNWPLVLVLSVPLAAAFLAVSARAGTGSQWYFYHYVLLLVMPLTLAAMTFANWIGTVLQSTALAARWEDARYLASLLAVTLPIGLMAPRLIDTTGMLMPSYGAEVVDPDTLHIMKVARPGDALVVWGWRPDLYVSTQLRQGISFATIEREVALGGVDSDSAYFRAQFMDDIARSRPRVVVDTTGKGDSTYNDRDTAGHEVFPEFTELLQREYEPMNASSRLRFYVRKAAP